MSTNHKESFLFYTTISKEHRETTHGCHKSRVQHNVRSALQWKQSDVSWYVRTSFDAPEFSLKGNFQVMLSACFIAFILGDWLPCLLLVLPCLVCFSLIWFGLAGFVNLVACSHLAASAAWFATLILGLERRSSFRSLGTFHHGVTN